MTKGDTKGNVWASNIFPIPTTKIKKKITGRRAGTIFQQVGQGQKSNFIMCLGGIFRCSCRYRAPNPPEQLESETRTAVGGSDSKRATS